MSVKKLESGKYVVVDWCDRCGGQKYFKEYSTTYEGVCFKCRGNGWVKRGRSEFDYARDAQAHEDKLDKAEQKRHAKREAEFEANRERYEAQAAEMARQEAEAEAQRLAECAEYQWLDAQVGESVEIVGKVVAVAEFESKWGSCRVVKAEVDPKKLVVWFSSAKWAWDVEVGEYVCRVAMVKSFDVYEGKKQTVVK